MVLNKEIEKASTLVEALPYIEKFRGETIVVKYGGSVMFEDGLKESVALDILLLNFVGIHPVIVHGGGKEISRWMEKVGKDAVFVDGLRFTDQETMEITEMVLSGKLNSEIVSLINTVGGKAVGLSGKDGNLFKADKIRSRRDNDLGNVGEITELDPSILKTLIDADYIPVISSVGACDQGESLNLNADHAAAELAKELGARKLIFLTDAPGVLKEGELVSSLVLDELGSLMSHPDIKGGMWPKLDYSRSALEGGVRDVHIIDGKNQHAILLEIFTDSGVGTKISHS